MEPDRGYHEPPDWWVIGPLIETINCSECGDLLIRYWDHGDYFCQSCGLTF